MARAAATNRAPSLRRRYFARFLLTGEIYGTSFHSQRYFLAASRPSGRILAMRFTKMQGCGNDFLLFDPGEVEGRDLSDLALMACDRHFGVGADGILIPAPSWTADLEMVYLNSDGSYSKMCGNGLRCLARYAKDHGMIGGGGFRFLRVSMGNPHAVAFLENEAAVDTLDLSTVGPPIEEDPIFPEKTNVEFGFARGRHDVRMRIWERGAGETLASGSGSCAVAVTAL